MLALLLTASLACGSGGANIDATVNAVSTAVEMTLAAMTQPGGVTPATATQAISPTPPNTALPSPTDFVPPSPTQGTPPVGTETPPTPTPTPEAVVRPNGPLINALRRDTPPDIDAQAGDWPSPLPHRIEHVVFQPQNWGGPSDQSATFAVAWDNNRLYLLVDVVDDVHVQLSQGELMYRGDSLELQLDADLPGDYDVTSLNFDDFQLGLSPGPDGNSPSYYLWNPAERRGVPGDIVFATRLKPGGAGYIAEVAIPWSLYGVSPRAGQTFGFSLNSSDNDTPGTTEQQVMISSVETRTLLNPTTWGTLILEP